MSKNLRRQSVKAPSRKISRIVSQIVDINSKSIMDELLENPKLVKTLQKLSLVQNKKIHQLLSDGRGRLYTCMTA